jgi:hypothetical protein
MLVGKQRTATADRRTRSLRTRRTRRVWSACTGRRSDRSRPARTPSRYRAPVAEATATSGRTACRSCDSRWRRPLPNRAPAARVSPPEATSFTSQPIIRTVGSQVGSCCHLPIRWTVKATGSQQNEKQTKLSTPNDRRRHCPETARIRTQQRASRNPFDFGSAEERLEQRASVPRAGGPQGDHRRSCDGLPMARNGRNRSLEDLSPESPVARARKAAICSRVTGGVGTELPCRSTRGHTGSRQGVDVLTRADCRRRRRSIPTPRRTAPSPWPGRTPSAPSSPAPAARRSFGDTPRVIPAAATALTSSRTTGRRRRRSSHGKPAGDRKPARGTPPFHPVVTTCSGQNLFPLGGLQPWVIPAAAIASM